MVFKPDTPELNFFEIFSRKSSKYPRGHGILRFLIDYNLLKIIKLFLLPFNGTQIAFLVPVITKKQNKEETKNLSAKRNVQ